MKLPLLISAILICLFASCKKEETIIPQTTATVTAADYLLFKPGTYWVYNHFQIDSNGTETNMNRADSIWIAGDSIINGKKYTHFRFKNPFVTSIIKPNYLYTDSLDYIVESSGKVIFNHTNFNTVLRTDSIGSLGHLDYKMQNKDSTIVVPSGFFNTSNFQCEIVSNHFQPRQYDFSDNFYSEGIGLVKWNYQYFSNPHILFEARLVRYCIVK